MSGSPPNSKDDAMTLYNLGCVDSLAGRLDEALAHVRRAIELEPSYREHARSDPDLASIRAALLKL